MLYPYKWFRN